MKSNMTAFRPAGFAPPGRGPSNADALEEAAKLRVRKVHTVSGEIVSEENGEEVITVRRFLTECAKVGASMKRTINTGKYESITIEASVYLPCYAEEASGALDAASEIAASYVVREEVGIRQLYGLAQVLPREVVEQITLQQKADSDE